MSDISVRVNSLTKIFGKFTAVDNLNFEVSKGEIFGFLGANGAGKTTTIRMLCGLLHPSSGEGTVAGFDLKKESERIKEVIGYMSQKFSLYPDLTAEENIYFYGSLYGKDYSQIKEEIDILDKQLNVNAIISQLTDDLPLGQKQIIALVAAIIHRPSVIFLDEPTSGVDPISRRNFWRIIRGLADNGTTVFVTTHFMEEAEYCDRISIMHNGIIIALDSPEQLKIQTDTQTIQELFIKLVRGRK